MTQGVLISDYYLDQNEKLHKFNSGYGTSARKNVDTIYREFIKPYGVTEILDYGCGKGTLREALRDRYGFPNDKITEYDPCHPSFKKRPVGLFDGVVCNDVLEHLEREYLDNVLKDILNHGSRVFYFSIGLCPSAKTLPDGRNAHILLESSAWWKDTLENAGFAVLETLETEKDQKSPSLVFYRLCATSKFLWSKSE